MNTIFSLDGTLSLRLAITLLHFLWQGLALAVIAIVCNASIGRKSAKVRYWISFSALMLMLACLLATFGLVGVEGTPRAQRSYPGVRFRFSKRCARDAGTGSRRRPCG